MSTESFRCEATETEDNWIHRSVGMRCKTCMYYVAKPSESAVATATVTLQQKLGRCRRHAPTMSGWPVMYESDWCGDHKLKS